MAKGILVSYAGYPYALSSMFPDNGLASLASTLRSEGHDCIVLDLNTPQILDRCVDRSTRERLEVLLPKIQSMPDQGTISQLAEISKSVQARSDQVVEDLAAQLVERCSVENAEFVGFKLWSGDGFEASIRLANRLRRQLPKIRLFAGGPAVHYSGHVAAQEAPVFDAIVDGDGEVAILELASFVEGRRSLEGVPNVIGPLTRDCATATSDLSQLPVPEYCPEVYPSIANGEKLRVFCLDESRGCPMKCAFCINWCIEGSRWRTRTVDQVLSEIREIRNSYGSRAFRLAGTYSHPRLVRQLSEKIIAEKLDIEFTLFISAHGVDRELIELLKKAGCFGIFCGVESGSAEVLEKGMEKMVKPEVMKRVLGAALETGLFTVGSFIFPAPFETAGTERETRHLIEDVFRGHTNASVVLSFPGLIPRTTWWNERSRFGFELAVDEDAYRRVVLRYKIQHLLPAALWEPLPYRMNGSWHAELARRTSALQAWIREMGIGVNMADYDALVGAALGANPLQFQERIQRLVFTGDGTAMQDLVRRANEALSA